MAYVSYSKGYKAGTFSIAGPPLSKTVPPVGDAVRPETLYAYEIGIKSELFERQLRANAALFYYDYRNLQLQRITPSGTTSAYFNVPSADIYGGELELTYMPHIRTGNLQISANLTLLDPQYGPFPGAPSYQPKPGGGNALSSTDATGNQMVRAPRIASSLGVNYSVPITDELETSFDVNWQHSGKYYMEVNNRLFQPAYELVSGQIALGRRDEAWRLRLWARNLNDAQYYSSFESSAFGDNASPAPPRTYGVNLDFKFGG
jgi:iron complex outermembrane receptor protein